jgi:hypothetical protein
LASGDNPSTVVVFNLTGTETGDYSSTDGNLSFLTAVTTNTYISGTVNGVEIGGPFNVSTADLGLTPTGVTYVCEGNSLTFTPLIPERTVVGYTLTKEP